MRRLLVLGLMSLLATAVMVPTAVLAEAEKVDVCHLNILGDWQVNSVSSNGQAVQAHLNHGDALPGEAVPGMAGYTFDDDCSAVADAVPLLALAYTEVDGIPGYDPASTDVLIAQFEDVDMNGEPSVGDIVRTNRYPLDINAASFGTFQTTEHVITGVQSTNYTSVGLLVVVNSNTGSDQTFFWIDESTLEQYGETGPGFMGVVDGLAEPFVTDIVQVTVGGMTPSNPDTVVNVGQIRAGDQDFINVVITPPAP